MSHELIFAKQMELLRKKRACTEAKNKWCSLRIRWYMSSMKISLENQSRNYQEEYIEVLLGQTVHERGF